MEQLMEFKVLNWNVAGAKYLEEKEEERKRFKIELNDTLKRLVKVHNPDVVTLQELVQCGETKSDILAPLDDYNYHFFPLIDSESFSVRAKWRKIEAKGKWPSGTYFAQGNGFLFKKGIPHQPVWGLPKEGNCQPRANRSNYESNYVEKVVLQSGLYFGDRDTEPRAALVSHFVYNPNSKPIDIFVLNVHLTTLTMEREGVPEIDKRATEIRLHQLDIIFFGIVSRYNSWRRGGFRERGERRNPDDWETHDRHEPVWVITGDFNSTPESCEYRAIENMNFMDVVPHKGKGAGTKAPGAGKQATLTLDYIFAGPKFISLNPLILQEGIRGNCVLNERVSDHFPMVATIPVWR